MTPLPATVPSRDGAIYDIIVYRDIWWPRLLYRQVMQISQISYKLWGIHTSTSSLAYGSLQEVKWFRNSSTHHEPDPMRDSGAARNRNRETLLVLQFSWYDFAVIFLSRCVFGQNAIPNRVNYWKIVLYLEVQVVLKRMIPHMYTFKIFQIL